MCKERGEMNAWGYVQNFSVEKLDNSPGTSFARTRCYRSVRSSEDGNTAAYALLRMY